ncbi:MAG: hypothetical protein ACOX48_00170 [Limnochordia bacterium]
MSELTRFAAVLLILVLGIAGLSSPAAARIERVYIVPMSHLDIGFTATQAEVAKAQKPYMDEALFYLGALEDFAWTIEEFWQLEQWLRDTPELEKRESLAQFMLEGRLELGGSYGSMHTGVMTSLSLARMLYPSLAFGEEWNVPVTTVIQNDVPGYTQDLPSILASAGIRYFLTGINTSLGFGGFDLPIGGNPFYWEGPDGQRILTWVSRDSYVEAYSLTLPKLRSMIENLEEQGYPYDAVLFISAMDNRDASAALGTLLDVVRVWNRERGESDPEVYMATPSTFFQYMEERYGEVFPVYSGEWGGLWERNKASAPGSTARFRWVQEQLPAVEALAALLGKDTPEARAELERVQDLVLLFAEHTGAAGAGWPGNLTKAQTDISNATVVEWMEEAEGRLKGLLAQLVPGGQGEHITVLNMALAPRSGPVTASIPEVVWEGLRDGRLGLFGPNGERVPLTKALPVDHRALNPWHTAHPEGTAGVQFWAEQVPPGGWQKYELRPIADEPIREEVRPAEPGQLVILENTAFRVVYDPAERRFTSLVDKDTGKELIDHQAPYPFFAVLRSTHEDAFAGKITDILDPVPDGVLVVENELGSTLRLAYGGESAVSEMWLWLPRRGSFVEWRVVLDQEQMEYVPYELHSSLYFAAMPFDLGRGPVEVFVEGPASFVGPEDYLPGANRGSLVMRRSVELIGSEHGVIISPRQAFAATLETPAYTGLEPRERPHILFELLRHFDEAGTRDLGPTKIAQEPGVERIAYEFRLAPASEHSPARAGAFGGDFHVPLMAVYGAVLE